MRGKAASSLDENKLIIGAATQEITRPVRVFQEKDGHKHRMAVKTGTDLGRTGKK